MLERYERVLKIICLGLAALLLFELVNAVMRHNPLEHMSIPAVPVLAVSSDAKVGGQGTNPAVSKEVGKPGTNTVAPSESELKGTNVASSKVAGKPETNAVAVREAGGKGTNSAPAQTSAKTETNAVVSSAKKGTNVTVATNIVSGTNAAPMTNANSKLTKRASNRNSRQLAGKRPAELPPVIQARVDKVVDSEILRPVIRPMPMGLLGIAGNCAFLRAPSGQTGLVKEGDELGEIKLLKIGINRVLVEEAGEKKELVIFDGYGSETLLPKPNDKPDEIITKTK